MTILTDVYATCKTKAATKDNIATLLNALPMAIQVARPQLDIQQSKISVMYTAGEMVAEALGVKITHRYTAYYGLIGICTQYEPNDLADPQFCKDLFAGCHDYWHRFHVFHLEFNLTPG